MNDQTCQKWFVKFCAGDISLIDASPVEVNRNSHIWDMLKWNEYVKSKISHDHLSPKVM